MAKVIGDVIGRLKSFFTPFDYSIERACVVHFDGKNFSLSNFATGVEASVSHPGLDFFRAIKQDDFFALYHNHPVHCEVYLSNDDIAVIETTLYTIGRPFLAIVTNFKEVKAWYAWIEGDNVEIRQFDKDSAKEFQTKEGLGFNLIAYLEELRWLYARI